MIYAIEFDRFIKVGKTDNFKTRLKSLTSEYGQESVRYWCSSDLDYSGEAEVIAHKNLEDYLLNGEKFSCSFEDAVQACMSACARSESMILAGEIDGIQIFVDSGTGYINATEFKKTSSLRLPISQFVKSEGVKYINQHIEKVSGQRSYFTCRGRDAKTFVHPYVFIEMLRSMGVERKFYVYKWMLYEMKGCKPIADCIRRTMKS